MKYRVTRASDWSDKKPCDEAFSEKRLVENVRGEKFERVHHYVNIETLEELMEFIEKYEEVVMGDDPFGEPRIEIYDDYRE